MNSIDDLANLPDDWDGEGSPRINWIAISNYRSLMPGLDHRAQSDLQPIPGFNGAVRMEWDRRGVNYTAELDSDSTMWLCVLGRSKDDDMDITLEFNPEVFFFFYRLTRS